MRSSLRMAMERWQRSLAALVERNGADQRVARREARCDVLEGVRGYPARGP